MPLELITNINDKNLRILALESINPKRLNMYFDSFSNKKKFYFTISLFMIW